MSNSTTNLDTISSSQASKEVTANALFDAGSPATIFGRRASTTAALTWGYYGGRMMTDGALATVANGTVALSASTTNYVEATRAGVVSKNTTAFTPGSIPLYTIVTGTASVTSYTDERAWVDPSFMVHHADITIAAATTTLNAAQARTRHLYFTGVLSANSTVIFPAYGEWIVHNDCTGNYSLSFGPSGGQAVTIDQGVTTAIVADGTDMLKVSSTETVGGAGAAVTLFLDETASFVDNFSLSTQPTGLPEDTDAVVCNSGVNGGVTFIERYVSEPLGGTSIEGGIWTFNTYAMVSGTAGLSEIITRINQRTEVTGITVTFTGAGATRTLTASGGTPFSSGQANASILLATLVETPTQTAWISGYTSTSVVTVTLTDPAFVNVAGVALSAFYELLFSVSTGEIDSAVPTLYETVTIQPAYPVDPTDRIVAAYFGKTDSGVNKTITLYHNGTDNYTNIETPLSTRHNGLSGLNEGDYLHLTAAEYAAMVTSTILAGGTLPASFTTIKASTSIALDSTKKLYFDGVAGTGDTYILESSANVLDTYVGGVKTLSLTATGAAVTGTLGVTGALFGSNLVATADTGRYAGTAIRLRNSTTDTGTYFALMPNGTSTATAVRLYNKDDATGTNTGMVELAIGAAAVTLAGSSWGTGTAPTSFAISLNTSITGTLSATDHASLGDGKYLRWLSGDALITASTGGSFLIQTSGVSTTGNIVINAKTNFIVQIDSNQVTATNATGLAVTGALSATGAISTSLSTTSTVSAVLARQITDPNFQLSAQTGAAGSSAGVEVSRFGSIYSGTGWDSFTQYLRGNGAQQGSQVLWAGNTAVATISSTGLAVTGTISATGVVSIGATGGTDRPIYLAANGSSAGSITIRNATAGAWAQTFGFANNAGTTSVGQFGAYGGTAGTSDYIYLAAHGQDYSTPTFKVTTTGVTVTGTLVATGRTDLSIASTGRAATIAGSGDRLRVYVNAASSGVSIDVTDSGETTTARPLNLGGSNGTVNLVGTVAAVSSTGLAITGGLSVSQSAGGETLTVGPATLATDVSFAIRAVNAAAASCRSSFTQGNTTGALTLLVDVGGNGTDRSFVIKTGVGGAETGRFNTLGLAVTGALSATQQLTLADSYDVRWGDGSAYIAGNSSTDVIQFVAASSERARISATGLAVTGQITAAYTTAVQGAFNGWSTLGGTNAANGEVQIGSTAAGLRLQSASSLDGNGYIDSLYDNAAGKLILRVRGAGTPVKVMELSSGAVAVTGDISVSTKTPASAAATGVTGTITWDASYIYVCTATNTWKRVAIATW